MKLGRGAPSSTSQAPHFHAGGTVPARIAAIAWDGCQAQLRYDALAGRYLHATRDDLDELLARIDEVREQDLNAIRLRR
jgi:3-oxoacyl-[acyl-carrier protein] reductase